MVKYLKILIAGMMASFYLFPFEFKALPGVNVKMMLAVLGLLLMAWNILRKRDFSVPSDYVLLFIFACSVSLAALLSITINQTPDTTYVSYIISFIVWLSASYAVSFYITAIHGRIDVMLIVDYLVGVCVFQCLGAVLIETSPFINELVNAHMEFEQRIPIRVSRLYGPGSLLDMAGTRFSLVLVSISFFLSNFSSPANTPRRVAYVISFIFISIIGNMIARTTLVGILLGIGIIILSIIIKQNNTKEGLRTIVLWIVLIVLAIMVSVALYNANDNARRLFRFGFEGFFALAEKGYWETNSTEILKDMIIFPDSLHTWIIGDGYFMNTGQNQNYLGIGSNSGYYMGTDIGYLRFIYYFGIVGLIPMMGVIIGSAIVCMRHFRKETWLFVLALLVGLVVWFKVSTDIFCFFALFLSAAALQTQSDKSYA